jgi:hypothetical protein
MIMRVISFSRFAALLLFGLGFGAAPAAAQCGGCYAAAPVVVQPVYSPCSCCGCGTSAYYGGGYYGGYYASAYAYPFYAGYGYEDPDVDVYAPRVYAPRVYAPRVYGPRRYVGPRYYGPRRGLVARY